MQKVLGIGGLFFRAEDPGELAKWYEAHLGVSLVPTSYEQEPWQQETGPTVFAPFGKNTTYFGDTEQAWMINFRVADLEAMAAQLRAAGIHVGRSKAIPMATSPGFTIQKATRLNCGNRRSPLNPNLES